VSQTQEYVAEEVVDGCGEYVAEEVVDGCGDVMKPIR
jgi:hypothetical protein